MQFGHIDLGSANIIEFKLTCAAYTHCLGHYLKFIEENHHNLRTEYSAYISYESQPNQTIIPHKFHWIVI